jgi:class 3 adenylate cyclase/tetratricopeptide (TPR) repeat protein
VEERRLVTVLFCDVTGSTALASQVDAEDWAEIISGAFPLLIEPVTRYGGTVARLMGDAILAFFGAPVSHEDDPRRALLAALAIQKGMRVYREQVREDYGLDFNVRVGINTGVVITGEFGVAGVSEYTAMGDAVNVAARMEQTARPGTIQITADTHALVHPYFTFEPLGPIEVKGKEEPVQAYRVTGPAATMQQASDIGAPLIGRERELAVLRAQIERLQRGQGGLLALIGEAGLGKSRLLREARQWLRPMGGEWVEDRLVSYETVSPFGLVRRRICAGLDLPEQPSVEQIRGQLTGGLPHLAPTDRERAIRAVSILFGSAPGQGSDASLGAQAEGDDFRQDLIDIVNMLWKRWIETAGFGVYVVDDLQHADMASLDVIEPLLSATSELPVLVILTLRPDHHTAAWAFYERIAAHQSPDFNSITLTPLSEDEAGQLVDTLLSGTTPPDEFRTALVDRISGNPLFAEEIVRSLIERGLVLKHQESGNPALRLAPEADLAQVSIPASLRSLMQERMDRLSPAARQTLQFAAVIGRTFRHEDLEAVVGAPDDLAEHLMELQNAMLITSADRPPAREYSFNHALTWEAAYQIILNRHRRRIHRQVGEALEGLYADQIAVRGAFGYAAVIADHFAQGGDRTRAAHWYQRAGSQAAAQFAHAEALRSLALALELIPEDDAKTRAAIILDRERIYHLLGRREEQEHELAELTSLAELLDDNQLLCEVLLRRAAYANVTGDYQVAISAARDAISLAEATGEATAQTMGHLVWGGALWQQGGYGAARAPLERALALARASDLQALEADALRSLGVVSEAEGDLAGSRAAFTETLRMKRALGDRRGERTALNSLGIVAYNQGIYADARAYLDEALTLAREIGDRHGQGKALHNLGIAAVAQGDLADARSWFTQERALTGEIGDKEGDAAALEGLGAVALYGGDFATAARYLGEALELFVAIVDQVGESETRANLSLLHHYQGDNAAARQLALDATRIAREVGTWQGQVRALTCLGHSQHGLGELSLAEAAYREAVELPETETGHGMAMEPLAGLARVSLARGAFDEAREHVEAIVAFLEHGTLDGTEDPVLVYLTCYLALRDVEPQRARSLLQAGMALLDARANRAGSEADRRSLLENILSHRALLAERDRMG